RCSLFQRTSSWPIPSARRTPAQAANELRRHRELWAVRSLPLLLLGGRWNFFVSNSADTEFVLGEESWVERDLVPISQSPASFQTHGLRATATIKPLELRFRGYVETIVQAHLHLLGEKIIG